MGLSSFLPGVLLLGIVIFFHELGHFLAAKWRGVTVLKFSLGMGPELIGFTHGGTRYCLSWIPVGGFVQMAGDHLADDGSIPEGGPEQFLTHPWYGRVAIALAGPAANLITAFAVLVVTCFVGLRQPDYRNELGTLTEDTRAFAAGLRTGDRVVELSGRPIDTWHDLELAANALDPSSPARFGVLRDTPTGSVRLDLAVPGADAKPVLRDLAPVKIRAIVGGVALGMPAYLAGIKQGDRVLQVDGKPIHTFDEISQALVGKVDRAVPFRFERDGRQFEISITPMRVDAKSDLGRIGIEAPRGLEYIEAVPPARVLPTSLMLTVRVVGSVYESLWLTLTRLAYYKEAVGGPIFIAQMAAEAARHGFGDWLYLLALINIAIMAFNLLPVPLLDGGHITLALLEGARRRAVSGRTYMNFQKVGLVLVGTLFVFILSKDLARPFQRLRAVDKAPRETTTVAPDPH